jgi:hypothetical protein
MKYLLLISLLFLISCKKERTIHISAKNAATGEGYSGLGFVLRETKGYVTSTGEVQKKVYEGTLNAQGEAVFNYKLKNNRSYVLTTLVPDEELCYINNTSYTLANTDDNFKFDFLFAECATLQRKVTNINCIDSSDKIEIYIDNTMHSTLNIPWVLNGCANSTTSPTKVPIGTYTLHWIVTKSNISTDYYDTFSLVLNETKIHEIEY